jgi:SsrA-binding protein
MPKETGHKLIASNKKARHDYHIDSVYEAGLVLTGTEVKSLRLGRASLVDGYALIKDGEVWLQGVHIPEYTEGTWTITNRAGHASCCCTRWRFRG